MNDLLAVGAGGFLGACARYLLGAHISSLWKGHYPLGTFVVNIAGSFLLGLILLNPGLGNGFGRELNLGLSIGFLGSFTTFSTLEYETLTLLENKKVLVAAMYVFSSFIAGLAAAWLTLLF